MKRGVLVISHGSRDPDWVALVDEAVAAVAVPADVPIVCSFLEIVEGRLIQDGIDRLIGMGVGSIYVIPLFVSSGSTHVDDIGQAFGKARAARRDGELAPFRVGAARVQVGRPIDDDPEIAELIAGNLSGLSAAPAAEAVLLVAHGSREAVLNGVWRRGMRQLAERVRRLGGYARAETAMLLPDQAACVLRALQRKHPGEAVLVAPLFLSRGYFTGTVIPARLAGLEYRYNGQALLPNPYVPRWMERQIAEWLDSRRNLD